MPQPAQGASPVKAEKRTSHRLQYSFRLEIAGTDPAGQAFCDPARTELITRDGGLIISGLSLPTGSHVRLLHGEKAASVRIVGVVGIRDEEIAYGIHFLDTSGLSFWRVEFPAIEPGSGVGRTVLECGRCNSQQVLELPEVEMMVLESVRVVSHDCQNCGGETLWQVPTPLAETELVTSSAAYAEPVTREKAKLHPQRPQTYALGDEEDKGLHQAAGPSR